MGGGGEGEGGGVSLDSFNGVVLRSRWIQLQRQRHEVDTFKSSYGDIMGRTAPGPPTPPP